MELRKDHNSRLKILLTPFTKGGLRGIFLSFFIFHFSFCIDSLASDQIPARKQERPIALVGGTIHTITKGVIEKGTILLDQGKITAIGEEVLIPANAEVIQVEGRHLYPGLISGNTEMGLTEIGEVRATIDVAEVGMINPNVRAEVACNPESELIPVTRANGITLAASVPKGGLIAGTSALLRMDGWTWEEMTMKAPLAQNLYWPTMTTVQAWWMEKSEEEQKKEREKALKEIENAFKEARSYWIAKKAERMKGIPYHKTDMRWEAMIPLFEKEIPLVIWANEIQQIESAVAFAERENLELIIGGGYDSWRVRDLLKKRNIPVLCGGVHRTPSRRWEDYDLPFKVPLKLYEAGIPFCIITDGWTSNERNLPYHAAMAAAYGLPKEEALKAITLYPAQIFGVDDRVGSLETGKDATLIVTTGDPLEITTQVEQVYINGKAVSMETRHTRLFRKYDGRPRGPMARKR